MRCYVSGDKIGVSIDKEDMMKTFERFGRISDVWVARQPPGSVIKKIPKLLLELILTQQLT